MTNHRSKRNDKQRRKKFADKVKKKELDKTQLFLFTFVLRSTLTLSLVTQSYTHAYLAAAAAVILKTSEIERIQAKKTAAIRTRHSTLSAL